MSIKSCVIIFFGAFFFFGLFLFFGTGNGEKLSPTNAGVSDRHVSCRRPKRAESRAGAASQPHRRAGRCCLWELRHAFREPRLHWFSRSRAAPQATTILCPGCTAAVDKPPPHPAVFLSLFTSFVREREVSFSFSFLFFFF